MTEEIEKIKNENPWDELLKRVIENNYKPLISNSIHSDKIVIDSYNKDYNIKNDGLYKLHTSMLPSHYTGNILNSSIVLLASNPGYDKKEEDDFYSNPKFIKETIEHLSFQRNELLSQDPDRKNKSSYWHDKLNALIKITNFENVSRNISKIQFNPYHSIKFKNIPKKYFKNKDNNGYLVSQNYGFKLLNHCIYTGKLIVVLRSKKSWFNAIPNLEKYEKQGNVLEVKNYRQPYLTPNNFINKNDFDKILNKLK